MELRIFPNGPFSVNTYLLYNNDSGIVIDPGHNLKKLAEYVSEKNITITHALLTHAHIDHVAGYDIIKNKFPGVKFLLSDTENMLLKSMQMQATMFGVPGPEKIEIDSYLNEGQITLGDINLSVFIVPGHSPGSACFYTEGRLFSGDTLFYMSIGRTDLFGSTSQDDLVYNIREKLFTLPDDTRVFPGHGDRSTIIYEKENNPFMR